MDRLQRLGFEESEYERPNRWWKCGHAEEGEACHVGPDALGRCRAAYECSPVRRGDRWRCTRPRRRGGDCEEGPRPDGTCACSIESCQPELTVRAKRGLTTVAAAALTLGVVLFLFAGPGFRELRRDVLSPGDLSSGHGAIENCAACHAEAGPADGDVAAAGAAPAADTARDADGDAAVGRDEGPDAADAPVPDSAAAGLASLGQSGRCMACHEPVGERPLRPHGLARDSLERIARELRADTTAGGGRPLGLRLAALAPDPPSSPEEGLACATCHEEHRGRDRSLTAMSDLRCQSCHTVQFASFERGHPEIGAPEPRESLPYGFDHAAHEAEHFPDEDAEFSCTGCHGGAAGAGEMGERGFETMCGECHAEEIREGSLTVLQLPGVDYEILDRSGVSVGTWPVDAGIDLTLPLSPVMRAMLSADTAVAADLRRLEDIDPYFLAADMPQATLRSVGGLAWGAKELFRDLAEGGRDAMADRLARGLGVELTGGEAAALTDQREVDEPRPSRPGWLTTVRRAREAWLPGVDDELERRRRGAGVPLRVLEDYGQPRAEGESWRVDGFTFSVRYLPRGHADAFLRELVEVSGRAASDDSTARRVFDLLTGDDAAGSCTKCHTPTAEEAAAGGEALWTEGEGGGGLGRLTAFDHEPHLVVACRDCHRTSAEGGIEPTRRETCASCHSGDRATASCLNCHRYHAEGFALDAGRSLLHPTVREGGGEAAGPDADAGTADTAAADSIESEGGSE